MKDIIALRFYSNSAYAEYKVALLTATGSVLAVKNSGLQ